MRDHVGPRIAVTTGCPALPCWRSSPFPRHGPSQMEHRCQNSSRNCWKSARIQTSC